MMKTTRTTKLNGDRYFMGIKVYDRFKDSPPAWLMILGAVVAFFVVPLAFEGCYQLMNLFFEFFL